jgi:hypothetical protein
MARKKKETRGRKANEFGPKKTFTIGLYPWAHGRIKEAALANGISTSLWLTQLASRELGIDLDDQRPPISIQEDSNA